MQAKAALAKDGAFAAFNRQFLNGMMTGNCLLKTDTAKVETEVEGMKNMDDKQKEAEKQQRKTQCERSIKNKEKDVRDIRNRNQEIDEKLRKLRTALDNMEDVEIRLRAFYQAARDDLKYSYSWKGSSWKSFERDADDMKSQMKSFNRAANTVSDQIRLAIAGLEGEKRSNLGIIGQLITAIDTLRVEIYNLIA